MVLASIIIGLGIAELLQTTSKMLRGIAEKGILHIFWSICTINQLVQYFWSSWRNIQSDWTYIELLLVILPTIILYLVSTLLSISKNQNQVPYLLLFLYLPINFSVIPFSKYRKFILHGLTLSNNSVWLMPTWKFFL